MPSQTTADLARAIQLSVAPVFLLLGIGGLLGVLVTRAGRVVDRARRLESLPPGFPPDAATSRETRVKLELDVLMQRATLVNRAIALCVLSALLVAAVIIALFVGVFFGENFIYLVSAIFIAALLALCAALLTFLREIRMTMRHLNIGKR